MGKMIKALNKAQIFRDHGFAYSMPDHAVTNNAVTNEQPEEHKRNLKSNLNTIVVYVFLIIIGISSLSLSRLTLNQLKEARNATVHLTNTIDLYQQQLKSVESELGDLKSASVQTAELKDNVISLEKKSLLTNQTVSDVKVSQNLMLVKLNSLNEQIKEIKNKQLSVEHEVTQLKTVQPSEIQIPQSEGRIK